MFTRKLSCLVLIAMLIAGFTAWLPAGATPTPEPADAADYEVVALDDVEWQQLNPLRGDKSPKAGTLWGDRTGSGPAGFLLKPIDGFKSPPHIHNVAYRGVVISGLIHNDDPDAEEMYMPGGSFWTQPAGGIHITAAKGDNTLAYIEVEDDFGVLPADEAFASPEKPLNVDVSNLVWVNPPAGRTASGGAKVAYLWGTPQSDQLNGVLVKLPHGFKGKLQVLGKSLRAVVIQGQLSHQIPGHDKATKMQAGSYFSSKGDAAHQLANQAGGECIVYLRTKGHFNLTAAN